MAKPIKFDESSDSEDLQALFDSIAAGGASLPMEVQVVAVTTYPGGPASSTSSGGAALRSPTGSPGLRLPTAAVSDSSGDSDDLQALFDSVVAQQPAAVAVDEMSERGDVFTRLGKMARELHNNLRELGYDKMLEDTARAIPDARERLSYIAQMTEQAASRVLNATDIAKPIQDSLLSKSEMLGARWEKVFTNQLSVDEFKGLAADTHSFLREVPALSRATNEQLTEIMMAQDFQDLTGQVIKKVVSMVQVMETQLLRKSVV